MKKRQFLIGLLIWLGVFGLGLRWAVNPSLWSAVGEHSSATAEQIETSFPFHLIEVSRSDLLDYADRLASEDLETNRAFSAPDWCLRETQTRSLLVLILWMGTGFFIHWFLGRIVRGQKSYTD